MFIFRVEKNYLNQGKCGLALIGNDKVHIYQLLLYKHKNDIISSSKLSNQFQFIVQKDNYATFSDDQSQKWTVHFNCDQDLHNFAEAFESRGAKVVKATDKTDSKINLKTSDTDSPKHDSDPNPSDTSENNVKANILSRMAKMGQKLLPNNSISDGTDSDTDKDKAPYSKPRKPKRIVPSVSGLPEIAVKPSIVAPINTTVSVPLRPQTINPQIPSAQIVTMVQQPYLQERNPLHVVSVDGVTSPVMYGNTPSMLDHLQMHFAENRTQNSEVRMNLLRLTTKMEEMLDKVTKIDNTIAKTSVTESKSENSNNSNTEALKWENEKLKQTIKKLKQEIEDEQHKITVELLEKSSTAEKALKEENEELKQNINKLTQALQTEENLIKSENVKLKLTITKLDQEVALLKEAENKTEVELHQQMLNVENKQETPEVATKQNNSDELIQQSQQLEEKNNELQEELAAQISKQLDYVNKIKELEQQMIQLSTESSKELTDKISVNKQKYENLDEIIKKIMNGLYYEINAELPDDESVVGKDVKQILARKIVDNTYSILSAVSQISVPLEEQNTTE